MPPNDRIGSRRDARREQAKQQLLVVIEAALDAGETYRDLSIGRLVDEAGLSRSTFYTLFEDKSDLLMALTEHVIADMIDAGSGWWALPADADKEALQNSLRTVVSTYHRHGSLLRAIVETAAYDPRVGARYEATLNGAIGQIATHIRERQTDGSMGGDLDPARAAFWITWMGERGLHQGLRVVDADETEALTAALTDLLWKMLYADAS